MATPHTKLVAQAAFAFLEQRGFTLQPADDITRFESDLSWHFEYRSPKVAVRILFDMHQFEVGFTADSTRSSYLFIDRELYGRRSGFHGDMFGPDNIDSAIIQIAADIEAHYGQVLAGDRVIWDKISKLQHAPVEKPRFP